MKNFLASDRSRWIFVIALISIGAGLTAKNVISYPTECMKEEMASGWNSLEGSDDIEGASLENSITKTFPN